MVVINFEDLPTFPPPYGSTGETVANQYQQLGITFGVPGAPSTYPTAFDYSQSFPGFAHSGSAAIELCYGIEFCNLVLQMQFTRPQTHVKVWVGYDGIGSAQLPGNGEVVIMRAYDASGRELPGGSAMLQQPDASAPVPIQTPLEVNVTSASIVRVTIDFQNAENPSTPQFWANNHLVVDDVEFDQGPPPPCPATQAPILTLHSPTPGAETQVNEFILDYDAYSQDPYARIILQAVGSGGTRTASYYSSNGHFGPARFSDLLFPGWNQLTVTLSDCFGPSVVTREVQYNAIDSAARFQVMGIEVTQAIQDLRNSVTLIANKRTFVRVYVRAEGPTPLIRNVTGWLTACRPFPVLPSCQTFLPGSIQSLKPIDVDSSTEVTAKRRDLSASLNFELPPEWIGAGIVHLQVALKAGGGVLLPCDGCDNRDRWGAYAFVTFQDAPPMRLQIVNITCWQPGACAAPTPPDSANLESLLRRLYPISTLISAPAFDEPLFGNGFPSPDAFFDQVNGWLGSESGVSVRRSGLDPHTKWYGMAKLPWSSGTVGETPKTEGESRQVTVVCSGDTEPFTGAHELGHVFGLSHVAGCNACGAPTEPDPNYPFPMGQIGNTDDYFGFDAGDNSVGATQRVLDPTSTYDLMSYAQCCSWTRWISQYRYEGLLNQMRLDQPNAPSDPAGGKGLKSAGDNVLITARLDLTSGTAELLPFWRLADLEPGTLPPTSDYSVLMLDAQGIVLTNYPFQPRLPSERDPLSDQTALMSQVVPFINGTARIVISHLGQEMAFRPVTAAAPVVTNVMVGADTNGNTVLLWSASDSDSPELWYAVEYSTNGMSWQTLTVDLPQASFPVNWDVLPGSVTGRFRVTATDGVNTGAGYSQQDYLVTNKPPRVAILSPANASAFTTSHTVVFAGIGEDLEDGPLAGSALQWTSSLQGALGNGGMISVHGLVPGVHTITLTGTDSSGATTQAAVQITVTAQIAVADAGGDRVIPAGTQVALDASASTGFGPLTFAWELADRPAGSQASLANSSGVQTTFTADVPGSYAVNLLIRDAVGGGAATRVNVTAGADPGLADLALTGAATPNPVLAGGILNLNFQVQNRGALAALGVTLTDSLPNALHPISAPGGTISANNVTWNLPVLESGSNAIFSLALAVDCGASNQTAIFNTASVTTASPETYLTDNVVSLAVNVSNAPPFKACLYVNVNGLGQVLLNPAQGSYDLNSAVILTAVPAPGWVFVNWTGDFVASANPTTLVLDTSKTVTANFLQAVVVTTLADGGPGSLRQAIASANFGDFVEFATNLTGTITLTNGELPILTTLTIEGPGANSLTISGQNASRIFQIGDPVQVEQPRVAISGLTLSNGLALGTNAVGNVGPAGSGNGGAILNNGTLTLSNCWLVNNSAIGGNGAHGSGIYSFGGGDGNGGAIQNDGTLALVGCTFSGNTAAGGTYVPQPGDSTAGGSGYGGAINNSGIVALTNCTLYGNLAQGTDGDFDGGIGVGGGINSFGTGTHLYVVNCTLSGNSAVGANALEPPYPNFIGAGFGGGISADNANAVLKDTLVTSNTVIAGAPGGLTSGPDMDGNVTSLGFNLIAQTNGSTGWTATGIAKDLVGSTAMPLDPIIGSLRNNGGSTPTIALLSGSPAINVGNGSGVPTDQRGLPRPGFGSQTNALGGDGSDIGAYEFQPMAPAVTTVSAYGIANTSATLSGAVNPNGALTAFWFDYGTTTNYGVSTVPIFFGGTSLGVFDSGLTGLLPGTIYHFRATGTNLVGVAHGADLTFQTPGALLVVTSLADSGAGTLRYAIANAIDGDGITFALNGTITLTSGPLNVSQSIVISGPGAANVSVSGNRQYQVFSLSDGNSAVMISGLTIRDGVGDFGGGVYNLDYLTLSDCVLVNNAATNQGGAVYNNGSGLLITRCLLGDNSATNGGGGGLFNQGFATTLADCALSNNFSAAGGGGAYNNGSLYLSNCIVTGNRGGSLRGDGGSGGGIYNANYLESIGCILTNNSAGNGSNALAASPVAGAGGSGGGICNFGPATLIMTNCTLAGNSAGNGGSNSLAGVDSGGDGGDGGAIFTAQGGQVLMFGCTLAGNRAGSGGGGASTASGNGGNGGAISCSQGGGSALQAWLCTLADNAAGSGGAGGSGGSGGGVYNQGALKLTACTLAGNRSGLAGAGGSDGLGGGVYTDPNFANFARLANTLVAHNTDGTNARGADLAGAPNAVGPGGVPFTSLGFNLVGQTDDSTGITNGINHDLAGSTASAMNPLLGPLADNGGPTWTMALLAGSPAIDAGKSFGLATDQRGRVRPVLVLGITNGGDGGDIGAFELASLPPSPPALTITFDPATSTVTISWPSRSVGFILQANNNLLSGNWSVVLETVNDNGVTKSITVNPTTESRFFRLKNP
jgi:hypothetical protein